MNGEAFWGLFVVNIRCYSLVVTANLYISLGVWDNHQSDYLTHPVLLPPSPIHRFRCHTWTAVNNGMFLPSYCYCNPTYIVCNLQFNIHVKYMLNIYLTVAQKIKVAPKTLMRLAISRLSWGPERSPCSSYLP